MASRRSVFEDQPNKRERTFVWSHSSDVVPYGDEHTFPRWGGLWTQWPDQCLTLFNLF